MSEYTDKLVSATREQLIGEVLRLRGDLSAMSAARDEACNWLEQLIDKAGFLDRFDTVAALRKVGGTP